MLPFLTILNCSFLFIVVQVKPNLHNSRQEDESQAWKRTKGMRNICHEGRYTNSWSGLRFLSWWLKCDLNSIRNEESGVRTSVGRKGQSAVTVGKLKHWKQPSRDKQLFKPPIVNVIGVNKRHVKSHARSLAEGNGKISMDLAGGGGGVGGWGDTWWSFHSIPSL